MNKALSQKGSLIIYLDKVRLRRRHGSAVLPGVTVDHPLTHHCSSSLHRSLTLALKKYHSGSTRRLRSGSCNLLLSQSMNIMKVSLGGFFSSIGRRVRTNETALTHVRYSLQQSRNFFLSCRNSLRKILPPREDKWTVNEALQRQWVHVCWR